MAILEEFGYNERFADALTTDEMQRLQAAHNTISVLNDKYQQWQHSEGGSDIKSYIQSKADAVQKERVDCDRVRSKFK